MGIISATDNWDKSSAKSTHNLKRFFFLLTACAATVRTPAGFKVASVDQAVAFASTAADLGGVDDIGCICLTRECTLPTGNKHNTQRRKKKKEGRSNEAVGPTSLFIIIKWLKRADGKKSFFPLCSNFSFLVAVSIV